MTSQEGDWKIEELGNGDLVVWFRGKLPRVWTPEISLTVDGQTMYLSDVDGLRLPRVERADFKAAVGGIP